MNKDFSYESNTVIEKSNNNIQVLNNQTIYSFLTEVDKLLDSNSDGYVAKQVFSGDDR